MGFRNKLDTEPVHSVTKDKLRDQAQGELCCYAKEQRADLSQQFASFCSLLRLSSYKRHKWYLYPPIMPQVLGRPYAISHSLNIYYAESAICSTFSHTSNVIKIYLALMLNIC